MTRDPETTAMDSSLAEVIHRLTVSDLSYLPILDDAKSPGIDRGCARPRQFPLRANRRVRRGRPTLPTKLED